MNFSKKSIVMKINNVKEPNEREVFLSNCGIFGVHKHFSYEDEYVLTHIPTGIKFPFGFSNKAKAKRYAKLIEKIADWEKLKVSTSGKDAGKIKPEKLRISISKKACEIFENMEEKP